LRYPFTSIRRRIALSKFVLVFIDQEQPSAKWILTAQKRPCLHRFFLRSQDNQEEIKELLLDGHFVIDLFDALHCLGDLYCFIYLRLARD